MRRLWLILVILSVSGSPALAGKNAGGALIVHTNDETPFLRSPCLYFDDPGTCEDAGTRTDHSGPSGESSLIWVIAAFDPSCSPGVSIVDFGVNHNLPPGWIDPWGYCGPPGTVQDPDDGWPENPGETGNSVRFGTPIVGEWLFPVYWFYCYGFEDVFFGTSPRPQLGYTAFWDDGIPPTLDGTTRFGQVRWFESGFNDCPVPPGEIVACCFENGHCVFLSEEECVQLGGASQGTGSVCDPSPCAPVGACCYENGPCALVPEVLCDGIFMPDEGSCDPNPCRGACCFYNGVCTAVHEYDCAASGGDYYGHGTTCDPNPCPQPGACCLPDESCIYTGPEQCAAMGGQYTEAGLDCYPNPCVPADVEESRTISTTWGRVKADYRKGVDR